MRQCPNCAQALPDAATLCPFCKTNLALQPMAAQPAYAGPPETNGKAIGSLVTGLLCFFWPASIAAVVLGHISRSEIRRSNGRMKGSEMAMAGLILGYIGITIIPILIIAAIAIPNLLRSKMAANEASAVGSLRTVNVACVTYAARFQNGYPESLANLGPGQPPSSAAADFIDSALASGRKSGYMFSYTPRTINGPVSGYFLTADPISPGSTGVRHFFVDETGVIRSSATGPANGDSPPLQ